MTEIFKIRDKVSNGELDAKEAFWDLLDLIAVGSSIFTKDDMEKAFSAGARNGSNAGMRVARGGDLYMEHFEEWFARYLNL